MVPELHRLSTEAEVKEAGTKKHLQQTAIPDSIVISTVYDESYTLTNSGFDLFLRGIMRALSRDPEKCHSCVKAYKQIYYTVLSIEQISY